MRKAIAALRQAAMIEDYPYPGVSGFVKGSPLVPAIVCPFQREWKSHPLQSELTRIHTNWLSGSGLTPPYEGLTEQQSLERVRRQDLPNLHSMCWGGAPSLVNLCLADQLNTYFWMIDECIDEVWIDRPAQHMNSYVEAIECVLDGQTPRTGLDPWSRRSIETFASLWARATAATPDESLQRHRERIRAWFRMCMGTGGCADRRRQGVVPSVASYLSSRPISSGLFYGASFTEIAMDAFLSQSIHDHPVVLDITNRYNQVISWFNDIYAFPRDVVAGDGYNIIASLVAHEEMLLIEAVSYAVDLVNRELATFGFLSFAVSSEIDPSGNLARYVSGLRSSVHSMLEWHTWTGRYKWREVST